MKYLTRFLIAGIVMGVLDFFWLAFVAKDFYGGEIGYLLLDQPNYLAAGVFYLIFLIGIIVFVINPVLKNGSLLSAIGYGALFGLVTYATYDLTNLATIQGFTLKVVLVDLAWGAFIAATTSGACYFLVKKFKF